jgi:hypothetical protein
VTTPEWVLVSTVATRLGISKQATHQRIRRQGLATRLGPTGTLVRSSDVVAWEEERARGWRGVRRNSEVREAT